MGPWRVVGIREPVPQTELLWGYSSFHMRNRQGWRIQPLQCTGKVGKGHRAYEKGILEAGQQGIFLSAFRW